MRISHHIIGAALLCGSCLVGHTLMAQSPDRTQLQIYLKKRVDSLFARWDKPNSPGCALGVIKDGEFIYRRGYGMANLENDIPINASSVFDVGSVSKQFTAACIVLLSQQGKLSLGDDVRKYIPELPDYGKTITIRHLLMHTSGLRDYSELMDLAGYQLEEVTTTRDALGILVRQKALNFEPGEEWLYSNSGFFLAAVIVERVSGQSMQRFAQENIFGPLGMTATMYLDNHTALVPHRATGYGPREGGGFQINMSNWEQTGDGSIQTSVEDLLRWDGNFYTPKVGGQDLIDQLLTRGLLNSGGKLHYALGLDVGTYRGLDIVEHGGGWAGYRAELIRFPKQRFSVVLLCNLATIKPFPLAENVADLYLTFPMKQQQSPESGAYGVKAKATFTDVELSRYLGSYRNPRNEITRQIILRNGKLFYVGGKGNDTELEPVSRDEFQMVGTPIPVHVKFTSALSGKISGMQTAVENDQPIVFESFTPTVLRREQLAAYAGTYSSEELDVNCSIALQDSQLVVRRKRVDQKPMVPTIVDVFRSDDIGVFRFLHDNGKAVTGFTLSTERVRNVMFKKREP
jgi:CubicO group peptidase (beta-lactamase class C family)